MNGIYLCSWLHILNCDITAYYLSLIHVCVYNNYHYMNLSILYLGKVSKIERHFRSRVPNLFQSVAHKFNIF